MAWEATRLKSQATRPVAVRPLLLGFCAVVAAGLAALGVAAQTAPMTEQKAPATDQTAPASGQTAPAAEYSLDVPAASAKTSSRPPQRMDVKVTLHKTETIKLATSFTEALVGDATVDFIFDMSYS